MQIVPSHPDHRTPNHETLHTRLRIAAVPTWPRGLALIDLYHAERLSGDMHDFVSKLGAVRQKKGSKMFGRVYADRLFPTVVTRMTVQDGIVGRTVHWDEPRILTILEVRRAQGYLDEEVLIGLPSDKMRIVGNSVDRKVALVLGLALRTSFLSTSSLAPRIQGPGQGAGGGRVAVVEAPAVSSKDTGKRTLVTEVTVTDGDMDMADGVDTIETTDHDMVDAASAINGHG